MREAALKYPGVMQRFPNCTPHTQRFSIDWIDNLSD